MVCSTIVRRLHHAGLHAHRPLPRLSLTPRHHHQRLQWCRTRLSWRDSEWQRVIFSDESRFSLGGDTQRIRVWRHRGQHRDERFVVTRPEDLVSLHLHPYRTICRNCVRMCKLHGMDYHRTPSGTFTAPYRDVWRVGLANTAAQRHTERQTSSSEQEQEVCGLKQEEAPMDAPARRVGRPSRKRKPPADHQGYYGVEAISRMLRMSQVDSCESLKEGVVGVKETECNGENENGVPQGALHGLDSSPDSSHQNGSDKASQNENSAPSTPRKKRGRRKLEHPEKHIEEDDSSSDTSRGEGDSGRQRSRQGWDISLRRRPVPRITYQAGEPYHITKRQMEEMLARCRKGDAVWTRDKTLSIAVLTTVPPHTDSLGVSTKTKAGLVTEDDPLPF
ncbi:hypothetical protein NFI96_022781 [Prochilodus magdalenae]|nr:hypothetical protein NFI96_022781 [Prochilodus magdalenae]